MFIGGCAGSTTCGIKVFRFQILGYFILNQIKKLVYPRGVFYVKYNNERNLKSYQDPLKMMEYSLNGSFYFDFFAIFSKIRIPSKSIKYAIFGYICPSRSLQNKISWRSP